MDIKRIKLYFLVLILLCLITSLAPIALDVNLSEDQLPTPVLVIFTVPALCCVLSLLCTNGFRNFRLDVIGIVSSGILVIAFGLLIGILYFIMDKISASCYPTFYVMLTLSICSFVGILPAIALHDTLKKNRLYIKEHGQQPGKFWRNLQYATLLSATLLLMLTYLSNNDYRYIAYYQYMAGCAGVQILFAALSLAFASVMLLAGWLWKQARIASGLSVVLLVASMTVLLFIYLSETFGGYYEALLSDDNYSEAYQIRSDDDLAIVYEDGYDDDGSEEYRNEDYGDYDYEDEMNYNYDDEKEGAYRPEFIGDGIIGTENTLNDEGDTDSIQAAVRFFVQEYSLKKEYEVIPLYFSDSMFPYLNRSGGNSYTQKTGSYAYDGLVKLIWRERKGMVIDGVFGLYSDWIKKAMPKEKYRNNGYELLVRQMMSAYRDLEQTSSGFSDVYQLMDRRIYYEAQSYTEACCAYYDLLKEYISADSHHLLFPKQGDDIDQDEYEEKETNAKCRAMWIYSFWGRRGKDGIERTVYRTMVKLDALYN